MNVRKVCAAGGRAMTDEELFVALVDPNGIYKVEMGAAAERLRNSPRHSSTGEQNENRETEPCAR